MCRMSRKINTAAKLSETKYIPILLYVISDNFCDDERTVVAIKK
jgi:hypothetical protein